MLPRVGQGVQMLGMSRKQTDTVGWVELALSVLLRWSLGVAVLWAVGTAQWSVLFPSVLALALTFLPSVVEKRMRVTLPTEFEFVFVVFVFSAVFLGEAHDFYRMYWWWDVMLHTISGVNLGFMGFIILFSLYSGNKIKASPIVMAVFSFSFALALGALWEIYEFAMDGWFGLNMQKSGLVDTMWDLIVDSLGAICAAVSGFFYIKYNRGGLVKRLVEKILRSNPQLTWRVRS